ncbi:class I SAM-dependent methyltransferase [Sphaerisporangium perillae]|uniref:class I SAM-dependent methyltransferase n=1 Tax=Sphaerisporangium perillae TaxID=2935860 RepID=UPI00200DBAE5|nr:class I SAM-dependent methyltransferase [Sphaerisporangium perillae]
MSVSTTGPAVAELLTEFTDATPGRLDAEYQRLAAALWNGGQATEQALAATPALVTALDQVGDDRKGHLVVLLGLLAEVEYPVTGGPLNTAVRQGLDRYLELLGRGDKTQPLTLALLYLLSHFPGDRDRILAAAGAIDLDPAERTRLERGLARLDLDDPDVGRVWPAPSVWDLTEEEREFDRQNIRGLSPAQITTNWENDTRTLFGYSGALAYWAVRYGMPVTIPPAIPSGAAPGPAGELGIETFAQYADALRCTACSGSLEFGETVRCPACSVRYPIAHGILDLSDGISESTADLPHEATANLLAKLAEIPSLGVYYEKVLRPAFLNIAGANWGGAVTPADEDGYIARQIRPVDGPVLDLAAGAGRWTTVVAKAVGQERLVAVDMGLPMLTVLRGKLPKVPAVRGSALNIPFEDASFGAVNCWNALQAFPDDAAAAIAEVGRVLRPGGTFTMMTFLFDEDPIARHFQESHYFPSRPEGMLLFEMDELTRWLADAGMAIADSSGAGTFAFVTAVRN